jgi:predicted DNA binding protein
MSKTLEIKQSEKKKVIIEHLKKAPIIQLACERAEISRMTFYRWKKEDKKFAEAVDEALVSGSAIVNDMAESKLITAIKEQNLTAIIFWLKHHHSAYATRVELAVRQPVSEQLTPDQEAVVKKALALASLTEPEQESNSSSQNHE